MSGLSRVACATTATAYSGNSGAATNAAPDTADTTTAAAANSCDSDAATRAAPETALHIPIPLLLILKCCCFVLLFFLPCFD